VADELDAELTLLQGVALSDHTVVPLIQEDASGAGRCAPAKPRPWAGMAGDVWSVMVCPILAAHRARCAQA
jgi:hypothetical protein